MREQKKKAQLKMRLCAKHQETTKKQKHYFIANSKP